LKRRLPFVIFLLVLLITALAVYIDWTWKRKLAPRGGRYFIHRVELAVPSFRQSDEKWRDDPLGGIALNGTLGCSTQRAGIAPPHAEGDGLSGVASDGESYAFISVPASFVGGVPVTRAMNPWAMPEASV
jgi:hypothetical protein